MFTADIRDCVHPPLPERFFGNAVIRRSATFQVSKVTSNPIQIVANTVKDAIDGITDEFIRSFIDYVEVNKDNGLNPVLQLPKTDLRIASISGMPVVRYRFRMGYTTADNMGRGKWQQSCLYHQRTGKRCWFIGPCVPRFTHNAKVREALS
jgi:hypothetical protein